MNAQKVRNCDCVNKVRNMFAQSLFTLIFVASPLMFCYGMLEGEIV